MREPSWRHGAATLILALSLAATTTVACRDGPQTLFESLDAAQTGVTFVNRLAEDTSFNILNYLYYYNGGGVAVGDINNDGLPDLYFTSNLGSNRLYLNRGNYRFADITAHAGVADSVGWKSGVTMADVNGDGYVDIYVSGVDYLGVHGRNVLYINNGDATFTDRTKEFGLEFAGFSTQALFFDYDGDGDLDMFLLNHSVHSEHGASGNAAESRGQRSARTGDRLYRNDNGHFVDVTAQSGIHSSVFGYGLGVVATDVDGDGCIDLYVANDFQEDDFLYHNNCNGTFTEVGAASLRHTSRSSMGVDAADFNNDGKPDVVTADMLPERYDILASSATTESYGLAELKRLSGYRPQLAHNTLQLNRGVSPTDSARVPRFSEVAFLAGVAATDWSWAPLFADLDNDGRKDLFITSGIYRRPNDLDYLAYVASPAIQASLARGVTRENLTVAQRMPHVAVPNHAFRNNGDLTFTDMSDAWGFTRTGFSNGAVYADLNNTGALDLVVNNVNAPASIYRNRSREVNGHHYLRVELHGAGRNTQGIGARVTIWQGPSMQMLEQMPTRGFESSVDSRLHFGLGDSATVDSLIVVWPNGAMQRLEHVGVDRAVVLDQKDAAPVPRVTTRDTTRTLFVDVTKQTGILWRHRENAPVDFTREPLLPHILSTAGPAIAVGDVNGDGREDLYAGGAKWQAGALFFQQRDGTFHASAQPAFAADSLLEDVDAVFFDANGDGRPDLYVVSGGGEFTGSSDAVQDRLYINDGHGNFHRDSTALPRMAESGACVVAGDFNGDGRIDLFVGRRALTGSYGVSPRSYLLENVGNGQFRDVTSTLAPDLATPGMVTSAAWVDYDHDGHLDLVVVGEWMPVRVFHQENGKFLDRTKEVGLAQTNGWWNTVIIADVNRDGRPDLVLGNLGRNTYLTATREHPARLYVGDFAHNRTIEPILTVFKDGADRPIATRDELGEAIPGVASRFPTYRAFATAKLDALIPGSDLRGATTLHAYDFSLAIAINDGNGTFTLHELPPAAQISSIATSLADDFDGDGAIDLLLAGNDFGMPPLLGRNDASYGVLLRGSGDGQFKAIDIPQSGLVLDGQVRRLAVLHRVDGTRLIVVARNDETLQLLGVQPHARQRP